MKSVLKTFIFLLILQLPGGRQCFADTIDNYQIYIRKKLMLTEQNASPFSSSINQLEVDSSLAADTIHFYFSHCTIGAVDRKVFLKDRSGKILFQMNFGDKTGRDQDMPIPIKELLLLPDIHTDSSYVLYYADKEYPEQRLITNLKIRPIQKPARIQVRHEEYSKWYFAGFAFLLILFFAIWRWRSRSE